MFECFFISSRRQNRHHVHWDKSWLPVSSSSPPRLVIHTHFFLLCRGTKCLISLAGLMVFVWVFFPLIAVVDSLKDTCLKSMKSFSIISILGRDAKNSQSSKQINTRIVPCMFTHCVRTKKRIMERKEGNKHVEEASSTFHLETVRNYSFWIWFLILVPLLCGTWAWKDRDLNHRRYVIYIINIYILQYSLYILYNVYNLYSNFQGTI